MNNQIEKKIINDTILYKIKIFDYIIYQLTIWYSQVCGDWKITNDLTKLKLAKLLFFVVVESTTNEDLGLLKIFNNFNVMPYGHFEMDVMDNLDKSIYKISKCPLELLLDETPIANDIVDKTIERLKIKAPNLIMMKPFDLVVLSHKYTSFITMYSLARRLNKLSLSIPVKSIQNDYKLYKLNDWYI